MRTLWPKQEYEQFRDHNAEKPFRKKRNKVSWRIDGRGNSGMRAGGKKNYFSKLIFAVSCNSFKLSLGTLEKEFET